MKFTFDYILTKQDLINFELFKLKGSKFMTMLYLSALVVIGIGTYYSVKDRDITYIIIMALYAFSIGLYSLYISQIIPKRSANNYVKKDVTYTQLRQITIDNECVEFKTSPKENEPMLLGVYPYNIIEAIIESKNYIQFVLPSGANIVPKAAIPQEIRADVIKCLKNNMNYVFYNKF